MTLNTLAINTCRKCGKSLYIGDKNIIIRPDDEVDIIEHHITCLECKNPNTRYMKSRKQP